MNSQVIERTLESGANMSNHAAGGVVPAAESLTTSPVDREAVIAIAMEQARTKSGGMAFKTGVLKDKVRAIVRSKLGLEKSQLVPKDVNDIICDVCDAVVTHYNASLAKKGYVQERASAPRNRIRGGEGEERLDKTVNVTHALDLTWTEQVSAASGELKTVLDTLDLHERGMNAAGKPDTRDDERRAIVHARLTARADKLRAVIARAERELAAIREAARREKIA